MRKLVVAYGSDCCSLSGVVSKVMWLVQPSLGYGVCYITFDTTLLSEQQSDPYATTNFRTPRYDLDAIYGRVPPRTPSLTTPTTGTSFCSLSVLTARSSGKLKRPDPSWTKQRLGT